MTEQRRYLYIVDEDGNEIAGSRRDISDISGDWRAILAAENELKRVMGEGCVVVDRVE